MNKKLMPLTTILIISLTLGTVYSTSSFFNDVPNNAWYYNAINNISNKKIMNGDSGNFRPDDYVTRAELAQTIHNMIEIGMFDSKTQIAYEDKIINTIFNTLQSTVTIETSKGVGGGLINSDGELIGIVVRKAMAEDVEGIGFAVPISTVKEFINK